LDGFPPPFSCDCPSGNMARSACRRSCPFSRDLWTRLRYCRLRQSCSDFGAVLVLRPLRRGFSYRCLVQRDYIMASFDNVPFYREGHLPSSLIIRSYMFSLPFCMKGWCLIFQALKWFPSGIARALPIYEKLPQFCFFFAVKPFWLHKLTLTVGHNRHRHSPLSCSPTPVSQPFSFDDIVSCCLPLHCVVRGSFLLRGVFFSPVDGSALTPWARLFGFSFLFVLSRVMPFLFFARLFELFFFPFFHMDLSPHEPLEYLPSPHLLFLKTG